MQAALLLLINLLVSFASAQQRVQKNRQLFLQNWLTRLRTGFQARTLSHDGLERHFLEHVPDSIEDSAPMVIFLHGGTLSMYKSFRRRRFGTLRWLDLSKEHGFLLVAPNGTRKRLFGGLDTQGDRQNWNDLRNDFGETGADDVEFIAKLVEWAVAERNVDPDRIYVTGASNGGMMTHRLILERPEIFAAAASFIANLPEDPVPTPASSTPIFLMNGDQDPLMPWEGGTVGRNRGRVRSALATRDFFVEVANVTNFQSGQVPDIQENDGCVITSELYSDGSSPVIFYTMVGGGHTYPHTADARISWLQERTVGRVCKDANGVDLAWEFMIQYSLADERYNNSNY